MMPATRRPCVRRSLSRPALALGVTFVLATALAACSGSAPPADPWAADFAAARTDPATTVEQRAVLADDRVTTDEFDRLKAEFVRCVDAAGYRVEYVDDEQFTLSGFTDDADGAKAEDAMTQCRARTLGPAETLYTSVRQNPGRVDAQALDDLIAGCMVRSGLVADLDGSQFRARFEHPTWDPDDPRYTTCLRTPGGAPTP
ncbi:hypothetical protein [Luteimicrobium subarcticum]|uniref:Lipoprotein n=1 Tax=Luteimicrobium subarcticum TaxID=620910 RepID=A0A2M8WIZ2_9MICO|nr:hypothetical protein [Luteimicrobium subarcticum]PJI90899.1 hypothetical protein CLV34_2155 [Luteimicrobium subarcticum]